MNMEKTADRLSKPVDRDNAKSVTNQATTSTNKHISQNKTNSVHSDRQNSDSLIFVF